MHIRPGLPPRKYSLRDLALRTIAATVLAGVFAAGVISLVTSDGIQQAGLAEEQHMLGVHGLTSRRKKLENGAMGLHPRTLWLQHDAREPSTQDKSLYDTEEFLAEIAALAQQPEGKVSRLHSSLELPLGPKEASNPLCRPFHGRPRTVAIVGNGPLSAADRVSIDSHDLVVRFNLMNNWQRFKERIDVWIMRHSKEAAAGYWGINNIKIPEADDILAMLKGVWLVGGNQSHADTLLGKHPVMARHAPVLLPEGPMNKAFAADMLGAQASYPSTGFVGIQAVLHCSKPDVTLHIYGFNWSKRTWKGHHVDAEQEYVRGLEAAGRAVVHATACGGMRECGTGDIDPSCHWTTDGRYMCLGGKPRKWIDKTDSVAADRQREFRVDVEAAVAATR